MTVGCTEWGMGASERAHCQKNIRVPWGPWWKAPLRKLSLPAPCHSFPVHAQSSIQPQVKPGRTNLNKMSAGRKSKFHMEKSFKPLLWIFKAAWLTRQTGILGFNIPQGIQQGVLYSLHLNANDNKTAWQYTLKSWFKTAREGLRQ